MNRPTRTGIVLTAAVLACALLLGGCGEKIALPQAEGLFSVNAYYVDDQYDDPSARDLIVLNGVLFVVGADGTLSKRTLEYELLEGVTGLEDPAALCGDDDSGLVFVWENGAGRLSAFTASDLQPAGTAVLGGVHSVSGMAASRTGTATVAPLAHTFLYMADPDSGVVHRYAWYEGGVMVDMGILCRGGGLSARYANDPAGLLRDPEGMMLVCDADTLRNWVIRFDPTPDLSDVAANPDLVDPWRGLAILFSAATCVPPVEADYVIGDARECGESWTGGPSDAQGEFTRPRGLAVDGLGRIFVADTGNDRLQLFTQHGDFELVFGDSGKTPAPVSLGVVDVRVNSTTINYGAYVFTTSELGDGVRKFISYDHYTSINQEPPPQ